MSEWSFLTVHARVLLLLAVDPDSRLRDIANSLGVTERTAFSVVTDLAEAGYVTKQKEGRRNVYHVQTDLPMRDAIDRQKAVGELIDIFLAE